MTALEIFALMINLIGLVLTGLGAWIAARAVMLSDQQADALSATMWNGNSALKAGLLAQSLSARRGLLFVVAGTFLQGVALVAPLLR